MPLPIQRGGFADQLRQLFRLTGRINSQLDETIVPVASVGDASGVPYALDPIHFVAYNTAAAVAAERGFVAIGPLRALNGCIVIDAISILNVGATANLWDIRLNQLTGHPGAVGTAPSQVNRLDVNRIAAPLVQSIPAQTISGSAVAAFGIQIERVQVPATATQVIAGPYVLPPDVALTVMFSGVNYRVDVGFRGRYFPDVIG